MVRLRLPVSLLLIALLSGCSLSRRPAAGEDSERSRVLWLEGVRARFARDLSTAVSRFETLARRHADSPQGRDAALRAALLLLDPTTPIFGPARAASLLTGYLSQPDASDRAEVERLQALVDELVATQSRTAALERDVEELRRLTDALVEERGRLLAETARQDSLFLQRMESLPIVIDPPAAPEPPLRADTAVVDSLRSDTTTARPVRG
jgi:hypothetical protein